ncbi:MAG: DUF4317 domain-containing protein [Lachnospiraceae bacterium]|jgi:hypothetical protein|nr:DUF4317 domain-containing protein [Lachnospiraceae bacterium]
MTKKEVAEIKKLFSKDSGCITRISGCYVGGEKEKITTFREAFYSLAEEDVFKYYEIFKKTLSGSLGKNLIHLEFPTDSEFEGGTQEFLLRLRNSELKDEELLEAFYDKVIQSFYCVGNYLILLIHIVYDVPGVTKDGLGLEDASEEVYTSLLCSICPVNLSKPGLSYHPESNLFQNCVRDWLVEMPQVGFLFPAFRDRSTDNHSTLYYTKNPDEPHEEFVDSLLGAVPPLPVSSQREMFQSLIEETLGEKREYETIRSIQENVQEKLEESKDEPEPLTLDKKDVERIFTESGVEEECMQQFDAAYDRIIPEQTPLVASNVVNAKKFEIKTPNITVQVKPEFTHLLETKMIDGRNCLVIAIEDRVAVNGIPLYEEGEET